VTASGQLPSGSYEHLWTAQLERLAAELEPARIHRERLGALDPEEVLARHVAAAARRLLRAAPGTDHARVDAQVALTNRVLEAIDALQPGLGLGPEQISLAEVLTAVVGDAEAGPPPRPEIPFSASALLVNGTGQPRIGALIAQELATAERVDLLCAFIKWTGLRVIAEELAAARHRGVPVRVITTTYLGATDQRALDALVDLGAEVRVSYDTRTTRLHAKAWLLHRATGCSTAYIGSSNLSRQALTDGLEWNVRITELEQPHLVETFEATFDGYWDDPSYEPYDPARDGDRLAQAIAAERGGPTDLPIEITALDVTPYGYQREMLDELAAERLIHDRWRNLVVAATGTGKTVLAALDYEGLRRGGHVDRLLFVAHREELLQQSLSTFRHVLRDGAFGELLVGGARPSAWTHVFASIQSLANLDLDRLDPSMFDMVVVDEFHHAMAPTYARLLDHVRPRVLLGLTATPERTDGQDVTQWFGGRIATELRLWEALERGLLAPFQYFGVHDEVDVSHVPWRRGAGYDLKALSNVYTAHHARVRLIVQALLDRVEVSRMRGLGFCVDIDHAEFMAEQFRHHGIAALAVSSGSTADERRRALEDLKAGRVRILFTVDLFNEGVDIPEVDTVLFLRPTESATVFLQQLGRGLRLADDKDCLTVLDFIGLQHAGFRFDLRYRALTGTSRGQLERQVAEGFPYLPPGCHIQLDRVASSIVLANVRAALRLRWRDLLSELRVVGDVDLATFLTETGVELEQLYRRNGGGWTALRREAGYEHRPLGADDDRLAGAIGRMLHIDDTERLDGYAELLRAPAAALAAEGVAAGSRRDRLALMLHFSLWGPTADATQRWSALGTLADNPARRDELLEVLDLLRADLSHLTLRGPGPRPLHVHGTYSRDEALAAFGMTNPSTMRQGVRFFEDEAADVFFVTLRKSEEHYSPTTRYNDYAVSPVLFHWESQSTTPADSPTGRRYQEHERQGSTVHLFIRETKQGLLGAPPYCYAGTASYVSHDGERPMKILWRLHQPLPPALFHAAKVATG
jgi:superfamily II DNA or RNA helicase/HKD family nuclease